MFPMFHFACIATRTAWTWCLCGAGQALGTLGKATHPALVNHASVLFCNCMAAWAAMGLAFSFCTHERKVLSPEGEAGSTDGLVGTQRARAVLQRSFTGVGSCNALRRISNYGDNIHPCT